MRKKKKHKHNEPEKVESPDKRYARLKADVAKFNPEFIEWLEGRKPRKKIDN